MSTTELHGGPYYSRRQDPMAIGRMNARHKARQADHDLTPFKLGKGYNPSGYLAICRNCDATAEVYEDGRWRIIPAECQPAS